MKNLISYGSVLFPPIQRVNRVARKKIYCNAMQWSQLNNFTPFNHNKAPFSISR